MKSLLPAAPNDSTIGAGIANVTHHHSTSTMTSSSMVQNSRGQETRHTKTVTTIVQRVLFQSVSGKAGVTLAPAPPQLLAIQSPASDNVFEPPPPPTSTAKAAPVPRHQRQRRNNLTTTVIGSSDDDEPIGVNFRLPRSHRPDHSPIVFRKTPFTKQKTACRTVTSDDDKVPHKRSHLQNIVDRLPQKSCLKGGTATYSDVVDILPSKHMASHSSRAGEEDEKDVLTSAACEMTSKPVKNGSSHHNAKRFEPKSTDATESAAKSARSNTKSASNPPLTVPDEAVEFKATSKHSMIPKYRLTDKQSKVSKDAKRDTKPANKCTGKENTEELLLTSMLAAAKHTRHPEVRELAKLTKKLPAMMDNPSDDRPADSVQTVVGTTHRSRSRSRQRRREHPTPPEHNRHVLAKQKHENLSADVRHLEVNKSKPKHSDKPIKTALDRSHSQTRRRGDRPARDQTNRSKAKADVWDLKQDEPSDRPSKLKPITSAEVSVGSPRQSRSHSRSRSRSRRCKEKRPPKHSARDQPHKTMTKEAQKVLDIDVQDLRVQDSKSKKNGKQSKQIGCQSIESSEETFEPSSPIRKPTRHRRHEHQVKQTDCPKDGQLKPSMRPASDDKNDGLIEKVKQTDCPKDSQLKASMRPASDKANDGKITTSATVAAKQRSTKPRSVIQHDELVTDMQKMKVSKLKNREKPAKQTHKHQPNRLAPGQTERPPSEQPQTPVKVRSPAKRAGTGPPSPVEVLCVVLRKLDNDQLQRYCSGERAIVPESHFEPCDLPVNHRPIASTSVFNTNNTDDSSSARKDVIDSPLAMPPPIKIPTRGRKVVVKKTPIVPESQFEPPEMPVPHRPIASTSVFNTNNTLTANPANNVSADFKNQLHSTAQTTSTSFGNVSALPNSSVMKLSSNKSQKRRRYPNMRSMVLYDPALCARPPPLGSKFSITIGEIADRMELSAAERGDLFRGSLWETRLEYPADMAYSVNWVPKPPPPQKPANLINSSDSSDDEDILDWMDRRPWIEEI